MVLLSSISLLISTTSFGISSLDSCVLLLHLLLHRPFLSHSCRDRQQCVSIMFSVCFPFVSSFPLVLHRSPQCLGTLHLFFYSACPFSLLACAAAFFVLSVFFFDLSQFFVCGFGSLFELQFFQFDPFCRVLLCRACL